MFFEWKMGWKVLLYVCHSFIHRSMYYLWNYYYTMCPVNISNAPSAQYIVIPMYLHYYERGGARWSGERNFARELVSAVVLLSPYSQHL